MRVFRGSYGAVAESVRHARSDVREFVRSCGADEPLVARVTLAVSEAASNVVLHAYVGCTPGEFRVIADIVDDADGAVRVRVEDDGRGMMPRFDSPGAGMGIPIIGQSSDRYEVQTSLTGGNEICMRFAFAAEASDRVAARN